MLLILKKNSAGKSSSGGEVAAAECRRVGGGCGFCRLRGIAAGGGFDFVLVSFMGFAMWVIYGVLLMIMCILNWL